MQLTARMTQLPVDLFLQLADYVPVTEAEGPGRRFAIWFQGCPLRCPGCCNPQMLPFQGGRAISVERLLREIAAAARQQGIEGVTLLGGEPVAQASAAAALASGVQARGLTVMLFSGYTLDELRRMSDPAVARLLGHCDLLVDGPYLRELPETQRRWIGSANQRVHFLTPRYRADDPCWRLPNTLEIRLHGQELRVNGFPAPAAVKVWKRPRILPAWATRELPSARHEQTRSRE
jgi:anaerobic ribonucleoside-triphosphate reductase activating protein